MSYDENNGNPFVNDFIRLNKNEIIKSLEEELSNLEEEKWIDQYEWVVISKYDLAPAFTEIQTFVCGEV